MTRRKRVTLSGSLGRPATRLRLRSARVVVALVGHEAQEAWRRVGELYSHSAYARAGAALRQPCAASARSPQRAGCACTTWPTPRASPRRRGLEVDLRERPAVPRACGGRGLPASRAGLPLSSSPPVSTRIDHDAITPRRSAARAAGRGGEDPVRGARCGARWRSVARSRPGRWHLASRQPRRGRRPPLASAGGSRAGCRPPAGAARPLTARAQARASEDSQQGRVASRSDTACWPSR